MSLTCQHGRVSLVRAWDDGLPFVVQQCDSCGAIGPATEDERQVDVFALPEMDLAPLRQHGKALDAEIHRLENLLKPNNPQLRLALEGARFTPEPSRRGGR